MALPSQAARPQSARRIRYSPRKRPSWGRRVLGLAVLTLIVIAVVIWGPWGGGEPPAQPDTDLAAAGSGGPAGNPNSLPIVNGTHQRDTTPAKPPTQPIKPPAKRVDPIVDPAANRATPESEQPAHPIPPKETPTARQTPQPGVNATGDPYLDKLIAQGEAALERNRLLDARDLFNRVLHDDRATPAQRSQLRDRIATVNDTLLFSPLVIDGDPITRTYTIRSGDSLSKIASRENLAVEWQLLSRVNKIADPRRIRVDQQIKLIQGPFHALVSKSDYRLDIYADKTDADGNRLYITSYPVGLGEFDLTPTGSWVVRSGKLIDPEWRNPRTGEKFASSDPANPIGERWIGLAGTDPNTEVLAGYGIHGTIEPDSIGKQKSMGCVRCLPQHVEVIYELLVPEQSQVVIVE